MYPTTKINKPLSSWTTNSGAEAETESRRQFPESEQANFAP